MLENGVHILGIGLEPQAAATSPEFLAGEHALWKLDMEALAPWTPGEAGQGGFPAERWTSGRAEVAWPVIVGGPCGSAMDLAWRMAAECRLPKWGSVLVASQRSGRGQMRREWCSPPGNLYAAWLWPSLPAHWDRLASLLAGYALCRALQPYAPGLRIKWPNDLLYGDHKVGGVLVEERDRRILVGFGLNLISAPGADAMRGDAAAPAGCLGDIHGGFGPLRLWLHVLGPAVSEVSRALEGEPRSFLRAMEGLLAWRGFQVRVKEPGERERVGIIVGLSNDGGLRLADDGGEQVLYSGSILPLS